MPTPPRPSTTTGRTPRPPTSTTCLPTTGSTTSPPTMTGTIPPAGNPTTPWTRPRRRSGFVRGSLSPRRVHALRRGRPVRIALRPVAGALHRPRRVPGVPPRRLQRACPRRRRRCHRARPVKCKCPRTRPVPRESHCARPVLRGRRHARLAPRRRQCPQASRPRGPVGLRQPLPSRLPSAFDTSTTSALRRIT